MIIRSKLGQFNSYKLLILLLSLVFFCFSISAALLFQKLILPHMSSMLAPGATLTADSAYFDSIALDMAQQIKQYGWSSWHLFPSYNTSLNVSLLAALYAVFGHDPTLAIPLNALLHALGGVLVFMIAIELSSSYLVGVCAGIIASLIFVLLPSSLNWYGQIHKDGYVIASLLLLLLVWLKGMRVPVTTLKSFYLVILSALTLCFMSVLKPYFFKLTLLCAVIILLTHIIWRLISKNKNSWVFFLYVIFTFVPISNFLNNIGAFSGTRSGEAYAKLELKEWKWEPSDLLPQALDKQLEIMAKTRVGLINYGVNSGADSLTDIDKTPRNFVEVMSYLPRAFQVALLAPFPLTWLDKVSMTRLLASVEMTVIYICLFGLFPLFVLHRSPQIILTFCFSAFFLVIYGFITANVGTLYRMRYPFELIMVLLGVIGWASYLDHKGRLSNWVSSLKSRYKLSSPIVDSTPGKVENKAIDRKGVINAGVFVSFLTLISFVGFFLRDVLMAHEFGFGKNLDEFYLALLVPMFIVTVFCTPFGAASVTFLSRIYERSSNKKVSQIISHLVAIVLGVMTASAIALYFLSPVLLQSFQMIDLSETDSNSLPVLLFLALIILIFSGVVILGNSVLMAKQRLVTPSAAQMVVPVIAILAMLLFGSTYGVVAVMLGMVVGQFVNLIIIHLHLKHYEIGLTPRYNNKTHEDTYDLWGQYFPLLASAFFVGVMLPIDTILASTLGSGNVSVFSLGMKIVLFISGLLGAVVSNVMLPYFSSIVEKNNVGMVKKELSFFMLIATFAAVPVSVMLYIWSEQIVNLVFYSNSFAKSDLTAIKSVMQYSVVQIPFFICNILLLKYATATRHLSVIAISALIGLVLNVGISLALMPTMGVSGIALATSISMMISSILILTVLSFYGHISVVDMVVVLLNWMLFLTITVAVHFQSMPSVVMTLMTYITLLFGYFKLINSDGDFLAVK